MKRLIKQYSRTISILVAFLLPAVARANSFGVGGGFDLTNAIMKLSKLLSGPLGGAMLVLALMFVGYIWLARGYMPKHRAMAWMGGASLIFGANWIYNYLWGAQ